MSQGSLFGGPDRPKMKTLAENIAKTVCSGRTRVVYHDDLLDGTHRHVVEVQNGRTWFGTPLWITVASVATFPESNMIYLVVPTGQKEKRQELQELMDRFARETGIKKVEIKESDKL